MGILTFTTEIYQTSYLFIQCFFFYFYFFIIIDRNSNWTHLCVLATENYMFDHLPRSTIMNAISIGLYIVHSVLIENTTILSHSFQTKLKKLKRFLLLLLFFLLHSLLLFRSSHDRHVLRALEVHASRLIQSNYKMFFFCCNNWTFQQRKRLTSDWYWELCVSRRHGVC